LETGTYPIHNHFDIDLPDTMHSQNITKPLWGTRRDCHIFVMLILCYFVVASFDPCTGSEAYLSPIVISVSAGTNLLDALKMYSAATGKSVYVAPTDMSALHDQFPAGDYTSDSFLNQTLTFVGADSASVCDTSVIFLRLRQTMPPLTAGFPYSAEQQSELDDLNSVLSSLSADDIHNWLAGNSVMHVSSFPAAQQATFMNMARGLGSAVVFNRQRVSDLSRHPQNFDVDFCVGIQIYLWSSNGICHVVPLSYTPSVLHDKLLYKLTSPTSSMSATQSVPKAASTVAYPETAANTLHGTRVKLPPSNIGYYALGTLARFIQKQTGQEIIVDKSLINRQILILTPNKTVDASDLFESMASSTGSSWRNVNGVSFLTVHEGTDPTTENEQYENAIAANAKLVSFVFQNLPLYVDRLTEEEFLREKRHWSTLTSQEQLLLEQIIPESPSFATDPGIATMLQDQHDLPDITVAYNISVTVDLLCQKTGFVKYYSLLGAGDLAN
jgi:hypothetical protein